MRLVGEGAWGEPPLGRDAAVKLLRRAVELGVNFFDTADAYGPHIAEELLAEALHPYPADLVVATKGGLTRTGPAKSKPLGRPDYLIQSVELSLRRLKLDRIDLYQLHRIDPTIPLEETLGALRDLQANGKIRHIGLSEVTPNEIERAQKIVPIASVQNKYNLTERKSEATLRFCEINNIAFLPWYPLAAGKLAHAGSAVQEFAAEHGLTLNQLSLVWLLQRPRSCYRFRARARSIIWKKTSLEQNETCLRMSGPPSTLSSTRKPADEMAHAPNGPRLPLLSLRSTLDHASPRETGEHCSNDRHERQSRRRLRPRQQTQHRVCHRAEAR